MAAHYNWYTAYIPSFCIQVVLAALLCGHWFYCRHVTMITIRLPSLCKHHNIITTIWFMAANTEPYHCAWSNHYTTFAVFSVCLQTLPCQCWYMVHSCITNPLIILGGNLGWQPLLFVAVHRPLQLVALTSIDILGASARSLLRPHHLFLWRWEVRHESDWRNNKHKTHTQVERGSMTKRCNPHKISVKDTNKSWLWLWVCYLFDFQWCKGFVRHLAVRLLWWGVIHNQF